jgi:hypothetical protein
LREVNTNLKMPAIIADHTVGRNLHWSVGGSFEPVGSANRRAVRLIDGGVARRLTSDRGVSANRRR